MQRVCSFSWLRQGAITATLLCLLAALMAAPRVDAAPSAGRIVYSGSDGLYTVAGDGGTPQRIWTAPAGQRATEPRWSPDGGRIAFIGPDGNVWVINADGTNAHAVTTQAVAPTNCGED